MSVERRGDRLYLRWWSHQARGGRGGYERQSLRHNDRELAERQARQLAGELLAAAKASTRGVLTFGVLRARYERDVVDAGLVKHAGEYRRRLDVWETVLGSERDVRTLDRPTLDRFAAARRAGTVKVGERKLGGEVTNRTIGADLEFLQGVLNWATQVTLPDGRRLLDANPVKGYPVPTTPVPKRPVASYDRFLAVRAQAEAVDPRFGAFMDLVEGLGWRVSALCQLRGEDVDRKQRPGTPHGRIRKRAATDKEGVEQWIPLPAELRASLDQVPVVRGWLFPASRDAQKPWTRWRARDLLEEAEQLAQLDPLEGGDFHAYRRAWATARKHHPAADVMAAGGWRDRRTLERSYQQVDPATLLAVVSEPRKLREVR